MIQRFSVPNQKDLSNYLYYSKIRPQDETFRLSHITINPTDNRPTLSVGEIGQQSADFVYGFSCFLVGRLKNITS